LRWIEQSLLDVRIRQRSRNNLASPGGAADPPGRHSDRTYDEPASPTTKTSRSFGWIAEGRASARPDEKNLVPPKNVEAEKGQAAKDLAFRLKLSAGGSLFRVGTHRRRRRPRGHCFFFFRTSAQA